jgi:hypothetical protein
MLKWRIGFANDDVKAAIDFMATTGLPAWTRAVFPIVAQLESYRSAWLLEDVTAGLAIAAVALPIGVAYPAITGLPPIVGLYASILPLIGYAILGRHGNSSLAPMPQLLPSSPRRSRKYRRRGPNSKGALSRRPLRLPSA